MLASDAFPISTENPPLVFTSACRFLLHSLFVGMKRFFGRRSQK